MIKAIDANMYLYLFVENIAPIQEIDTANCIHFKLNSVVLNIHIDKKDNAKTNIIAFNIYFSFILDESAFFPLFTRYLYVLSSFLCSICESHGSLCFVVAYIYAT